MDKNIGGVKARKLIVMFGDGNEEGYRAFKVMALENRRFSRKVEFISIASPRSKFELQEAAKKVSANVIGQYNEWEKSD